MLAVTQLQALTGPEGSSQCLSGLLAFTMAGSVTLQNHLTILRASSEFMRLACIHPTASTEWARRAHSVLVRPACVHQGKVHNPTASTALALRAYAVLVRLACVNHGQIHNPTPSTAWARRAHALHVRLPCGHHSQIHNLLSSSYAFLSL